ncbi:MAG: hypothetical protein JJD92_10305 [Frankiaceae bacterium]|nr:hypothetical protein [Frankiaceae bacterium]
MSWLGRNSLGVVHVPTTVFVGLAVGFLIGEGVQVLTYQPVPLELDDRASGASAQVRTDLRDGAVVLHAAIGDLSSCDRLAGLRDRCARLDLAPGRRGGTGSVARLVGCLDVAAAGQSEDDEYD